MEVILQLPLLSLRQLTIEVDLLLLGQVQAVAWQRLCLRETRLTIMFLLFQLCFGQSLCFVFLDELRGLGHVDSQLHLHLVSYVFAHHVPIFTQRHWYLFHLDLRLLCYPAQLKQL